MNSAAAQLAGYLHRRADASGQLPGVVMGHGFSGTQDRLFAGAERFARAGMAALTFDYRSFGESGGEPRQVVSVGGQLAACGRRKGGSPSGYFLLVFAFSLPFWLAGALTELRLLPGLPVSALMFVCPAAAALLLYAANGTVGVRALLERSFDHKRMGAKIWYAPALLLMPAAMVLMYGLMRSTGLSLPPPEFPVMAAPALFVAFFFSALGEELGWSGYATDPLQDRRGALRAAVILGSVSAAWHVVPLAQVGRSPGWIAWWCLFTLAGRVLIVWVYNNVGKSVFAATLFHTSSNVSWQLFPNQGSHWDPRIGATIVLVAAAAVTYLWGPKTLSRFRYGTRAA